MSRIQTLIEQLEAGQPITQDDLRRVAQLQALDTVRMGEEFFAAELARENEADEQFRQLLSDSLDR